MWQKSSLSLKSTSQSKWTSSRKNGQSITTYKFFWNLNWQNWQMQWVTGFRTRKTASRPKSYRLKQQTIEWLLWSAKAMNTNLFQGKYAKIFDFLVSIWWQKVTPETSKRARSNRMCSISSSMWKTSIHQKSIFHWHTPAESKISSGYVCIKMRHIMEWKDVRNQSYKDNLRMFYQQQLAYCKQTQVKIAWQIVTIDTSMTGTDITIGNMIAGITLD